MTSKLNEFLTHILKCLRQKDGQQLTATIVLDFDSLAPEQQQPYSILHDELNSQFPRGRDEGLSVKVKQTISADEFGGFHSSFTESIVQYFRYLRDFSATDNLEKAKSIRQLTSQCILALGNSQYGVIMIPIVLSFSRVLGSIATNLDRNLALVRQSSGSGADSEGGLGKISFVETAANVLRDAFIKCLAGSPGKARDAPLTPDDKRSGIYLTANSCMKLLYRCGKLKNMQQIFQSIDAQSPPLAFYPSAQRVTYLYYLGRYHFANSHFYRAQRCLQSAYEECHVGATKQRKLILTFLLAASVCLGRLPSWDTLALPEANWPDEHAGLALPFKMLSETIKEGDVGKFESLLDATNQQAWMGQSFLQWKILYQIRDRCEILVWRSLIRRVFDVCGNKATENIKSMPHVFMERIQDATSWSRRRSQDFFAGMFGWEVNDEDLIDPDFAGLPEALAETGFDPESGSYMTRWVGQEADGTNRHPYTDMYTQIPRDERGTETTFEEVNSVVLSLIAQGFIRGFVLHDKNELETKSRLVIRDATKSRGTYDDSGPERWKRIGFPSVWHVVVDKEEEDRFVPGWVTSSKLGAATAKIGGMGGRVISLAGARPAGS